MKFYVLTKDDIPQRVYLDHETAEAEAYRQECDIAVVEGDAPDEWLMRHLLAKPKFVEPNLVQAVLFLVEEVGEASGNLAHRQAEFYRSNPNKDRSVYKELLNVIMMALIAIYKARLEEGVTSPSFLTDILDYIRRFDR